MRVGHAAPPTLDRVFVGAVACPSYPIARSLYETELLDLAPTEYRLC
jgi:hypothetical protein